MCHDYTTRYVRVSQTFDGPAGGTRLPVPRRSLRLCWRDHDGPIWVFSFAGMTPEATHLLRGTATTILPGAILDGSEVVRQIPDPRITARHAMPMRLAPLRNSAAPCGSNRKAARKSAMP